MRRGSKPTLYELMSVKSLGPEERPVVKEAGSRNMRVPVGFMYLGIASMLLLLLGTYWVGYLRGSGSVRSEWDRVRSDTLAAERSMRNVVEVEEPGGGMREAPDAGGSTTTSSMQPSGWMNDVEETTPTTTVAIAPEPEPEPDPAPSMPAVVPELIQPAGTPVIETVRVFVREPGMNYYIIDHPSRQKVDELVAFCRQNGLEAHKTLSASGSPKVFVTPGYRAGQSAQPEIVRLREQIRQVGILWERLDPGRNSDFSTRYAEKYRPSPSGG